MNIKVLKKASKKIRDFEKKEWDLADQKHFGQAVDWNPKRFAIVAYEKKEIIATLEFHIKLGVVIISTLIVSSKNRGQGIGTMLLNKVEDIAKQHNTHKIYLTTGKGWDAENLYKKFGMVQTGELSNHYANRDFVAYSKYL